ncbi:MAG: DoxX family protein [Candidatus Hydrogenedentes bacterium]|nr:DoxX family protein [Candidatus Hydrogenedentota bacterium]
MADAPSKARNYAAWGLVGLLTALFAFSSFMKLSGMEEMVANFETFGLADMRIVIGIGEIVSAVLFLIPLTSSLGVLLLSAHMGGAIVTHMSNDESYIVQSVVLILVWVAQYLRYPELFVSFRRGNDS